MTTQLSLYNGALIELGEETIASLSEQRKGRYVLDSVYSEVLTECLEAGASDYLAKPVNTEQLLSALRMWLHR